MHHFFQPLNHLRNIRVWARRHDASVSLDAVTFRVTVTRDGRVVTLVPRFIMEMDTGFAYTNHFGDDDTLFCGWLPYDVKRWPLASDKLAFKQYCEQAGLPVPAYSLQGMQQPDTDFIVKGRQGSFGRGIRGPFRSGSAQAQAVVLSPGQFFEQFVQGECAKIWCWNGCPVAMERLKAPFVVGDGVRSLRELLESSGRGSFDVPQPADKADHDVLAWQGLDVDSVPALGQRVVLDFRYASPFDRTITRDRDVLSAQSVSMRARLHQMAGSLAQGIPPATREHTIFTVDAIVDEDDQLWLLEMNSHPMVHPASYVPMLDSLFGVDLLSLPRD
ncbi:hypothetical protein [Trinickia fusca]|uniref:ATP-grasp domain-containing protein n=1 Tax=Trinickia fusca TaxID=2419777 RepID=A0A494XRT1_9BURK|nr:hypothetical protein [Trinickia fusca]RKP52532.1 hypothetical protein D7S89_03220 [Trinickia fusca]